MFSCWRSAFNSGESSSGCPDAKPSAASIACLRAVSFFFSSISNGIALLRKWEAELFLETLVPSSAAPVAHE